MAKAKEQDAAAREVEYWRQKHFVALAEWHRWNAGELRGRRPTIYPTGAERQGRIEAHEAVAEMCDQMVKKESV